MKKIFILTGEPSGDKLASTVISKLKENHSNIDYLSVGGDHLNKLGIKSTDLKGNELNVNEFNNNTPEWFIFGWPDALENLMNKIN